MLGKLRLGIGGGQAGVLEGAPAAPIALQFASQLVTATVEKSPDRNICGKITKVLGGVASVVNVAFPIVKPFLKKK